jgi:hypothetical protein
MIRFATKQDFEEILRKKEFTYYSWDYINDASKILNFKNISLYIEDRNNKYIIPLMKRRILGFYPVAFSIPFGLYGGVMPQNDIDEKTYVLLMNEVKRFIKIDIIFQNVFQEELLSKTNFTKIKQVFTHFVFTKNQNFEKFYREEFSSGMREGVKRGAKNGITVKVGNSIELIEDLYKLYEVSNRRWGNKKPRYSIDFFKEFAGKEYIEVRIAYYKEQPASGLFVLKFSNYCFPWFGGMEKELRKMRANDYLYADLVKSGIENNFTLVNFGASGGNAGITYFKESFGAKGNGYHIYFIGNPITTALLKLLMKYY